MKHTFLHKPVGTYQTIPANKWTDLWFLAKRKRFYCDRNGQLSLDCYTRFETDLKPGEKVKITMRLVREPFKDKKGENGLNPTMYTDFIIDGDLGSLGMRHWQYTGEAQKGRKYLLQVKLVVPEGQRVPTVKITTRYAQFWAR